MASNAAVPFWRAAGMTYITYSNICANLVRNCLKEPYKSEVLAREKVHFSISKWTDGKPQKPKYQERKAIEERPNIERLEANFLLHLREGREVILAGKEVKEAPRG
ncbi:hypothetical protein JCGZ_13117 [Jatropha curcas]|uniref:ATP synthase subunit epsilon, mitochondrial n=1 Tax=Jatropha curcas TaxID=180498 RepID=A0A067K8W5_JATCU|nr:hypothetical protein JCGZ_13117 [Jatropha curcas]